MIIIADEATRKKADNHVITKKERKQFNKELVAFIDRIDELDNSIKDCGVLADLNNDLEEFRQKWMIYPDVEMRITATEKVFLPFNTIVERAKALGYYKERDPMVFENDTQIMVMKIDDVRAGKNVQDMEKALEKLHGYAQEYKENWWDSSDDYKKSIIMNHVVIPVRKLLNERIPGTYVASSVI